MFGVLKGKKTYVTATITVIGALAAYLVGDASMTDTAQLVITAVLGATVRHGIG